MARKPKEGVDYFPHMVNSGKTIFMLEAKFGNDGYAFWFKLLEILGQQPGLSYDCNNQSNWIFLSSKCRVSEISATEILDMLASVDAIDPELWKEKIIWVQNLCDNVADVFNKRHTEIPQRPHFCDRNDSTDDISDNKSTQSKVKEIKVNKNIDGDSGESPKRVSFKKPSHDEVAEYCRERGNSIDIPKWFSFYEANGWKVGKNPMKDWKGAVRYWEPEGFKPKKIDATQKPKENDICPRCNHPMLGQDLCDNCAGDDWWCKSENRFISRNE